MNRKKELLHDVKYGGMVKLLITYIFVFILTLIATKIFIDIGVSNEGADKINVMDSKITSEDIIYYLLCGFMMCIIIFAYAKTYIGREKKLNRELERLGLIYSNVNRDYINGKDFGKMATIYNIGLLYTVIASDDVKIIKNYKIISVWPEKRVFQKIKGIDVMKDFLVIETNEDIIEVAMERNIIEAVIAEYKKVARY